MEKHSCKTYFSIDFEIDIEKNAAFIRAGKDCTPEDLGIFNKAEVEKFIVDNFDVTPEWDGYRFVIGRNEIYNVYVNEMLVVTLTDLFGKEDKIKEMQKRFGVTTTLEIVPYIASDSNKPTQCLSLSREIIEFLYKSNTEMDLDYYIV